MRTRKKVARARTVQTCLKLRPSGCTVPSCNISLISTELFAEDDGTSTQTHTSHLDICNTVTGGVEMLCHRKSRGVVAYASQVLTNSTPETLPSFADVDMGTSAAGYTVHKIFRCAGEMIA